MRRSGRLLGAAFLVAVASPFLRRVARSWPLRVSVGGHSMEPALLDGDWLLVDPAGSASLRIELGDLVVARDPRRPERLLIKRVVEMAPDGWLSVVGDHPAHDDDVSIIGQINPELVVGRPWLRYWPPKRMALV